MFSTLHSAVWVLPVLGEEVNDVKGGSVHQSHGQMKGCLTLFLPQQTKQETTNKQHDMFRLLLFGFEHDHGILDISYVD